MPAIRNKAGSPTQVGLSIPRRRRKQGNTHLRTPSKRYEVKCSASGPLILEENTNVILCQNSKPRYSGNREKSTHLLECQIGATKGTPIIILDHEKSKLKIDIHTEPVNLVDAQHTSIFSVHNEFITQSSINDWIHLDESECQTHLDEIFLPLPLQTFGLAKPNVFWISIKKSSDLFPVPAALVSSEDVV